MDEASSTSLTIPTKEPLNLVLSIVRELSDTLGAIVETVDIDQSGSGEIVLRIPRA